MAEAENRRVDPIVGLFSSYPGEDLEDFLPVLLLSSGVDTDSSRQLTKIMDAFYERAGVRMGMTDDEATDAVSRYIAGLRLNPDLVQRYRELLWQMDADEQEEVGAKVSHVIGADGPRRIQPRWARGYPARLVARPINREFSGVWHRRPVGDHSNS